MTWKSTEELYFMTLECDAKLEEKLTCGLENDMRNLGSFYQSIRKSQNWDLDGILLSKAENVWEIFSWNLHFNGLLLTKVYNVWANESTEDLCLMVLNIDAKFEGKLTCAFKNGMVWHISAEKHSTKFFFFFFLRIFLKIISQFCISQWSVRRKVFDKLLWLFQLGVFVIFAIRLASICILLPPLFTDLPVRNSF